MLSRVSDDEREVSLRRRRQAEHGDVRGAETNGQLPAGLHPTTMLSHVQQAIAGLTTDDARATSSDHFNVHCLRSTLLAGPTVTWLRRHHVVETKYFVIKVRGGKIFSRSGGVGIIADLIYLHK